MKYYEDPILGKGRAADVTGGTGGSGTAYIGGFAIGISGDTISRLRYMPIESVTGNSVTLQAGHAYKAYATSTAITLNTETVPEGQFGMEGHIEIYVAGTGYVVTGTNVVLANALEPDSVNNCTLRFHDGVAIIDVEDHVAGYIVVNGATSGDGSLYYGISTSTNDYVAFDASLNGTVIPLAGAVAEGEKHIVGNGRNDTFISGTVTGTSQTTFTNLTLSGSVVANGATEFSDGIYHVDTVTGSSKLTIGSGAIIDLTGNENETPIAPGGGIVFGSNVKIYPSAGSASAVEISGGTFLQITNGGILLGGAVGQNEIANGNGATLDVTSYNFNIQSGATIKNFNVLGGLYALNIRNGVTIQDCTVACRGIVYATESCTLAGTVKIERYFDVSYAQYGTYIIASGAIIDFTGNANAAPINPTGTSATSSGAVVVDGGCTVITSAGASVSIAGGTYTKINNDGTTE